MQLKTVMGATILACTTASVALSQASAIPDMTYRILMADEGKQRVTYVNLSGPSDSWSVSVGGNRDMQLVGNNRVMLSVRDGYQERDLTTGALLKQVSSQGGGGVASAFRLKPNSTILSTVGGTISEVDSTGKVIRSFSANCNNVRIVRPTSQNTFLVGGNIQTKFYEVSGAGNLVKTFTITSTLQWDDNIRPYMGLRLPNGNTVVSTGYGQQLVSMNPEGQTIDVFPRTYAGDTIRTMRPFFFGSFQILPNGNFVVANWQGHGMNGSYGRQVVEFNSAGSVVSWYKQDSSLVGNVHGVLVLDGLDPQKLCTDINGILWPIGETVGVDPAGRPHREDLRTPRSNSRGRRTEGTFDTRGRQTPLAGSAGTAAGAHMNVAVGMTGERKIALRSASSWNRRP